MRTIGIGPRDVAAYARDTRAAAAPSAPLLVTGVLADHLARALGAGGDPALVRTAGDPAHAAALVRVVAGPASTEDAEQLRAATRAQTPLVVVQTGDPSVRLPYVLATDVVDCKPGQGFPVEEIAQALARVLGRRGAALAGSLPVLRPAVQGRRIGEGALLAGLLALKGGGHPALGLAQARVLADVRTATSTQSSEGSDPRATAEAIAVPLGASIATGLAARAAVRRLPIRNAALDAVVAAATTLVLASLYRRVATRGGSVRSGS